MGLCGKKSRGDKTPLELFLTGLQGWEGGLRQFVSTGRTDAG